MSPGKDFAFSEKAKEKYFRAFIASVKGVANAFGIPDADISISDRAFGIAVREAEIDLSFVQRRRGFDGPSFGKMAGCLLFRLCRHRIVHLAAPSSDHPHADLLQDAAAFDFVLVEVLKVNPTNPYISGLVEDELASVRIGRRLHFPDLKRETIFLLRKRHYNQETLGVIFDALRIVCAAGSKILESEKPAGGASSE